MRIATLKEWSANKCWMYLKVKIVEYRLTQLCLSEAQTNIKVYTQWILTWQVLFLLQINRLSFTEDPFQTVNEEKYQ